MTVIAARKRNFSMDPRCAVQSFIARMGSIRIAGPQLGLTEPISQGPEDSPVGLAVLLGDQEEGVNGALQDRWTGILVKMHLENRDLTSR